MATRDLHGMGIFEQLRKGGHSKIIPVKMVKFHQWFGRYCITITGVKTSKRVLLNFLVTVKAAPHECVIRTGLL